MNFEELGASLRAERERKGLSIDDVAEQLKINLRQLRALENGEVDSLPHPAYVRGFIRSYATWLGMGQDEIRDTLEQLLPETRGTVKKFDEPAASGPARNSSHGKTFLLVICLLAASGWAVWKYGLLDRWFHPDPARVTVQTTLPTADEFMAARDAEREAARKAERENRISETAEAERQTPVPFSPATQKPEPSSQHVAVAPEPVAPEEPAPETGAEEEPAAVPAPEEPEQHKLIITAVEECWVHSNADKTDTRQFSLRKGDTFALTFADSLELKLGNAGGVRLRYDGRDLPPPGTSGQVRTLNFPPKES